MREYAQEITAGFIVLNESFTKTLMLVSKEGYYGFPKGHVEAKDQGDLLKTAKRETREELNIKVTKKMMVVDFKHLVYQYIHRKESKRKDMPLGWVRKEIHLFLCIVPEDIEVTVQESEVTNFRWINISQLENVLFKNEMKIKKKDKPSALTKKYANAVLIAQKHVKSNKNISTSS